MQNKGSPTAPSARDERLTEVMRALEAGDTPRAVALADAALAAGDQHGLLLNLSAFGAEQAGDLEGALSKLRQAVALAPDDILALTALGNTLSQLGRDAEALGAFEAALARHPGHAPAHHGRGLSLTALGHAEEARHSHMRAADLDPNYADPLGALADYALSDGRADLARTLAERAVSLQGDHAAAVVVLATLDAQGGDRARATERLQRLLSGPLAPLHRGAAENLLADQLDALDRPVEAFDAVARANRLMRDIHAPLYERTGVETGLPLCARLKAYFETADPADWTAAEGDGDAPGGLGHVFLVGFVRSGTTLLEQVLASHPDVTALEEKATLRAVAGEFFDTNQGLDRLATLGREDADRLRADYWRRVRGFGIDPTGKVFVDKAPLSTLWLPMVAKLFPKARVLFAIRDPRDVVVSAFRHRFLINALALPFTDLKDTATFYSGVMDLAALYRETCALTLYQHRHEDLVADFDAEVGRICDFLGLQWTDAMRDFAETAKRRDVRTPSAEQVRRGLYSEGVGRWRRYGPAVDPILPILAPWVKRYGYPE